MSTIRSNIVVGGVPLGPITDTRLPGPPPETNEALLDRHAAHIEEYAKAYGEDVESIKSTWDSNSQARACDTPKKAGWTTAKLIAIHREALGAMWDEYPPDE